MQPGSDFNPYAAPTEHTDRELSYEAQRGPGHLATLSQRWWGSFLDNLFAGVFLIPGAIVASMSASALGAEDGMGALLMFGGLVPYVGIQAWLVTSSGQSLGKKLLKTRIVTMNGEPPGFVRGVLLRSWLIVAMNLIPLVNSVVGLVDALFIFRSDRRTLHDHIAGTTVIQVL